MGKCDETSVEVNMGDSASPMKPDIFTFTVPPEAPVFEPTPEEFLDPLAYISKIRPIAEKSGICKIKPPEEWQPPFAVDVDRLRFTPRIQRLNELEAITRVKLNFLDQIVKFWELQGSILKIPIVERKPLDLYTLNKIVKEAGGFEVCSAERKWSKIASRMGHPQGKGVGSILKSHYERILYPYDIFKNGEDVKPEVKVKCKPGEVTPEKAATCGVTRGRGSAGKPSTPPTDVKPTRRWKKLNSEPESEHEGSQTEGALAGAEIDSKDNKDLKKLTPGKIQDNDTENKRALRETPTKRVLLGGLSSLPARPTRSSRALREHRQSNMTVSVTPAPEPANTPCPDDPLAKYICHKCGRGDVEEQMLLCDGCDDSYHTFCLVPPLADVPKGDWRCPRCIAQEVSKPTEAFGFEQARREYTLQQFGEMADQFKSEYFNMPVHMVPTSTVEKEFWRIVSSIDEDVTVEYGADLHSMDHGSGFPTKSSLHLYPGDQEYAESSWNLNNLPLLEGSVLGHINADISGMKVPWMYVGMCFATFCWHNEDHWSYSINYLHWGEPKTWYGVPGSKAEQFETTMRSAAPELFQWQPDLLHQLVTIMNPNILMRAGVPVYRTDQKAGEFVITFPRAYHAGFNQGYNFAEAVNFTPADWLKIGRDCIAHYSNLRRFCVFSHDELVCKMALEADALGLTVALAAYQDMRQMLADERKLRKSLLEWGVTEAEREAFELLPDDERQCHLCKTTCFLSAVTCTCTVHISCLRHYVAMCTCQPVRHKLRYRYTLDELPLMLDNLKRKSDAFREWADSVQNALDPDTPKTCDLDGLKAHLKRAHELKMHKTDLVRALEVAIEDAEKCASVIHQLDLNKMRTRTRHRDTAADPKYRLSVKELTLFCEEIDGLACVLPEGCAVKEVLRQTVEFERRCEVLLAEEVRPCDASHAREVDSCVELGSQLCIQLERLPQLVARQQQVKFLEEVRILRDDFDSLTLDTIDKLLEGGAKVQPHYTVETQLAYLTNLKGQVEEWETRARAALRPLVPATAPATAPATTTAPSTEEGTPAAPPESVPATHSSLAELDQLLGEGDEVEAALPSRQQLASAVQHARDWLTKVEKMQSKESYPYYHTLEAIVRKGQTIPLSLYEKDSLASALQSARQWKEKTARTFLKKSWVHSLMEALSPRTDILTPSRRSAPRSRPPPAPSPPPSSVEAGIFMRNFSEENSPTEIVAAFKAAEEREMANMRELRARNLRKDVRAPPQPGITFCICQKRQFGVMNQCELCKDWFHVSCVAQDADSPNTSPSRSSSPPRTASPQHLPFPHREDKFLCPSCLRTKRPRLEVILELLVWLQALPVRLAEGEALQCVTERAMSWQDAARLALKSRDVAAALARHHSGAGGVHQFGRDKNDKLTSELRKATGRPGHNEDLSAARKASASEHAYSASPRSPPAGAAVDVRPRLPPHVLHKLDELMMEGDLLEVTLDETAHVWNVLSAARGGAAARVWSERLAAAPRLKRRHPPPPAQLKRQRHLAKDAVVHGKLPPGKKRRIPGLLERKIHGAVAAALPSAATTTNYLNRKQGMSSGSGLMMKKHYMAKQERRRRGLAVAGPGVLRTKATRGRRALRQNGKGRPVLASGSAAGPSSGAAARAPAPGRAMPRPTSEDSSDGAESSAEDEEDDCAAQLCLRPTGKVDWVQCDGGCDKWFHMHCVGLVKNSLKEDEDYYCTACGGKPSSGRRAASLALSLEHH